MALKLIASYSKRLGLPGYSSHQFSVTLEAELTGADDVASESARLYATLQESVDSQICQTGYVHGEVAANGAGSNGHTHPKAETAWLCSDKQRELITRIVEERQLVRTEVEKLAHERFGKGVRQLNKLEASGLIDELIEKNGQPPAGPPRHRTRGAYRTGGAR